MELLLAATPFVAALGLVAYAVASMRGSARWEREGWHELDRLCTELVGQLDQTAVMRMALADSLVLLRCELVMVVRGDRERMRKHLLNTSMINSLRVGRVVDMVGVQASS